jgi:hypothetical protein
MIPKRFYPARAAQGPGGGTELGYQHKRLVTGAGRAQHETKFGHLDSQSRKLMIIFHLLRLLCHNAWLCVHVVAFVNATLCVCSICECATVVSLQFKLSTFTESFLCSTDKSSPAFSFLINTMYQQRKLPSHLVWISLLKCANVDRFITVYL